MAFDTRELREKHHKMQVDSRELLDKADVEKRALTNEERGQWDLAWKESEELREKIEDHERANKLERAEEEGRLRQQDEESRQSRDPEQRNAVPSGRSQEEEVRASPEYHAGFCKRLLRRGALNDVEERAQVAGKGEKGGYLYASEQFMLELLKDVDDAVMMRQISRTFSLPTADSLGVPTVTTKMSDAEWTSELGIPSRDQMKFGKRALTPHPLAKEAPVSKVLIAKAPGIMGIIREELARIVGTAQENGYMTGHGAQQPLGIFTPSADGISTDRDVSTHNTGTLIKADNLIEAQFTLKQAYWANARWIMHRDAMKQIAKLKDGEGQYLLRSQMLGSGTPIQSLLGFPVILSEFAPNTMTSGLYVYVFGDFNNYWIVDGLDADIQRLEELLARQNQDLFIIRAMSDGAPVREEAFVRGKLG
jgi:HK97 family phage major capsid protein